MKILKRSMAMILALIICFSVVAVAVEAVSVTTTNSNYGYMIPTNAKFTKTVSTVKLYGSHDYINFYINSEYDNRYFFYEIYSDKKYTKLVTGDVIECDEGAFTWSPLIKLKGVFKSGTYYCITYAAKIDSKGNATIANSSVATFKLVVDRTTDFTKQVVLLKSSTNTVNGPKITWYKHSSAATKYTIYRRSLTGTKWTTVGSTNGSTLTFTDKSVKDKNGEYVYTVKAFNKKGQASRYQFSGITVLFAKTPVISSVATVVDNAIQIKWNSTSNSTYYRLYRKTNGGNWEVIKDKFYGTSYTDKNIVGGNNYQYTVRAYINTSNGKATSSYYPGKAVDYVAAPKLVDVVAVDNGVEVSWEASVGATAYTVYRRPLNLSESWTILGKVSADIYSFIDETVEENASYRYTVRSEGKGVRGSYLSIGGEYVVMEAPEAITASVKGEKLELRWSEIANATDYEVYMQDGGGEWVLLTKVNGKITYSFIPDRTGELKFQVRGVYNDRFYGGYSDVFSYEYYPDIEQFIYENRVVGNYLSWKRNTKAEKYNIYRGVINNNDEVVYELYSEIPGNDNAELCEFTDADLQDGIKYSYVVKGVYQGVEQMRGATCQINRLSESNVNRAEKVKFVRSQYSSIVVVEVGEKEHPFKILGYNYKTRKWCDVYYQTSENEITIMEYNLPPSNTGEYKISVVYNDGDAQTSIDANIHSGTFYHGGYGDITAKTASNGIKISWDAVKNAKGYVVSYMNNNVTKSVFTKVSEFEADNRAVYSTIIETDVYSDKGVDGVINIDAIMSDNQCNRYVVSINAEATPELYKAKSVKSGSIEVYWNPIANNYSNCRVYRKIKGETNWQCIKSIYYTQSKNVDGKTYEYFVDDTAIDGVDYTYTVRRHNNTISSKDFQYLMSHYDEVGVSAKSLATPTLTSAKRSTSGITVKWGKVTGADGYYVYRKTSGSGWSRVGTVKNGSTVAFKDTTAKAGTTYYYTVKAYSGSSTSGYVKNGIKCS